MSNILKIGIAIIIWVAINAMLIEYVVNHANWIDDNSWYLNEVE